MPQLDREDIDRRFTHHVPDAERTNTHGAIREAYKVFAQTVADWLPDGREKSLAFTALEESSFWAHAAVARDGAKPGFVVEPTDPVWVQKRP